MSGAPEDKGFDRGYCCAVANILRTHGDTVIARDVLRANEPGDWNDVDVSDRDIIFNMVGSGRDARAEEGTPRKAKQGSNPSPTANTKAEGAK